MYYFFQLVDISVDGFLSMMLESGELREDIKLPEGDLGADIKQRFEGGEDMLVSFRHLFIFLLVCQ